MSLKIIWNDILKATGRTGVVPLLSVPSTAQSTRIASPVLVLGTLSPLISPDSPISHAPLTFPV